MANYGDTVQIRWDSKIEYPDFVIELEKSTEKIEKPEYYTLFWEFNLKVTNADKVQTFPLTPRLPIYKFQVGGKPFSFTLGNDILKVIEGHRSTGFLPGNNRIIANYGDTLSLKLNEPVEFPDFILEFIGSRKQKQSPGHVPAYYHHDYYSIIGYGQPEKVISFTSGSGAIGLRDFTIAGKTYSLSGYASSIRVIEGNDLRTLGLV